MPTLTPLPSLGRPLAAGLCLLCAAGCVGAGQNEITPLREELAALRQAHDADRKRLDALELELGIQQGELRRLKGDGSADVTGSANLPIVHLKARAVQDLPPLPTNTLVREPPPEIVADLQKPPADSLDAPAASDEADAMYKAAFEKLTTGDLVGAASDFHAFAQRFPHHPAADNAMLDEGIAFYGLKRYQEALDVFAALAKRYPAGDAVSEGLWRAGDCHLKLGQTGLARSMYQSLIRRYPGSPEALKATAQLAAIDREAHVASTEGGSQ